MTIGETIMISAQPSISRNRQDYLDLLIHALTASIYPQESSNRRVTIPPQARYRPKQIVKRLCLALAKRCNWEVRTIMPYNAESRELGRDWPGFAYTMIGHRRLANIQACIESVLDNKVPGDFIEAGVWRGGATIFMRAVLRCYGITDRTVWVADSFEGMPAPNGEPADNGYDLSRCDYLVASLNEVKTNFECFGLLDGQVKFVKGWFCDTLPTAPIDTLAMLRIDGDLYKSTIDVLNALYYKVSPGGFVIIDDYHSWPPCREAVEDFRSRNNIGAPIQEIDGRGVFWQVTASASHNLVESAPVSRPSRD